MKGRSAAPPEPQSEPAPARRPRREPEARSEPEPERPSEPRAAPVGGAQRGDDAPPEEPRSAGAEAGGKQPSTEAGTYIPDDVELGLEELPPGFWDDPPAEPRGPAPAPAAARTAAPPVAKAPVHAEGAGDAEGAEPPTELEEAFAQLQSLFPGRVIEVVQEAPADDAALQDDVPMPGEGALAGYDEEAEDEDQDRLSFGPQGE